MQTYGVAVIDPPWPKKKGGLRSVRPRQGRELDYKTATVPEIFELLDREVLSRMSPDHAVFMWTVDEFLSSAESEMERRGYRRHARLVWDKGNGPAPAFSVRYSHEYLLWFYKAKFLPVAAEARGKFKTVLCEPAREHSRKPDCAYSVVRSLYPLLPRIDVFSREKRDGWDQWGDQCGHFSADAEGECPASG